MRLAVYTDYAYRRDGDAVYAERAFVLFLAELSRRVERMVLVGRMDPRPGRGERSHYRVPDEVDFVPLPHYESLAQPLDVARAMAGSVAAFDRALHGVDAVWLLGPHPLCLPFAAQAAVRRRRVFLGVRQDLPRYARSRHPGRRSVQLIADALEGSYRLLARVVPAVVVGPDLARRYAGARRLLALWVSLVHERELPAAPPPRAWDGPLTALSVGRLEAEKNPLLLADVIARLRQRDPRWRLVVCGEGPLGPALRERVEDLGLSDHVELAGYVPLDGGLSDLYRESHALLHVSFTEGVPQILLEAFAAGLPIVATGVGGVPEAVADAGLLVPPADAEAPADALYRIGVDADLRETLAERGLRRVREHTIEAECERLLAFMRG